MAGDEPEVLKKHHRSSEDGDGAEEGSKRRKHSHHRSTHRHHHHHRHHHRHRSTKHDHETNQDDDFVISSSGHEIPPIVVSNLNSRPDDDKEEGEILDEEDFGVANGEIVKKDESDVESGEIKSAEAFSGSELRNLRVSDGGEEDTSSGRNQEVEIKHAVPLDNDIVFKLPANRRDHTEYELRECSDGKGIKEMYDEADILKHSKTEHSLSSGKDYEIGETDTEPVKLRQMNEKREHRDRKPRRANGDISYTSYKEGLRTQGGSESSPDGTERESIHRDYEAGVLTRDGRSRSPVYEHDFDLRKHRNVDDNDAEGFNLARHISRKHSDTMDIERNCSRNQRKLMSPESMEDRDATDGHHDCDHVRRRSRSRDHVRERRSRSRSYFPDDSSERVKHSSSREKDRNEADHRRALRHDRDDRHGSRDWVRDRERERSSSYSRYGKRDDKHISWDIREKDRDRLRENERERVTREMGRERVRDSDRHRVTDRNIDRNRHGDRQRDRHGKREGDDLYLDGYRNSRRSERSESESYQGKRSKHHSKASNNTNEELEGGKDKLKGDEDEQEDYEEKVEFKLVAQEEDEIDRIKEESRKRMEAIKEKYRKQQQEKQAARHSEDSERDIDSLTADKSMEHTSPAKLLVNSAPEGLASRNNGLDEYVVDSTFAVVKSPVQNGPVTYERAPGAGGLGDGTPKSERSEDMFCDDIFGESPAGVRKTGKGEDLRVERSGLNDNWDDAEGYYSYRFGEVLDGRYEVIAAHGKGVFSTVVRAKDLKAGKGEPEEVAIKIIRNNDTMYKAGLEELIILKKLAGADPEDRRHCVRFTSSFKYRNHLCLVFESLHMNLREVLKKFGRNIGLKLTAVRAYAKQLFIALKHLRNCGVLHCDIKPDNMLVNEAKTVLKLCDFGNAMFAGKNEITPYLVSRFYRAPEIILGLPYDHPMDIWSVGCCLYELYSGKVLFPGPSNNDMLRLHMELKGPFPKKLLRKGAFTDQHFDNDMNFGATEEDPVTKKTIKRLLHNIKPKDISAIITGSPGEDPKMLANFKDLLEKIFMLDPEKRMTVSQALNHPFITGK